MDFSDGRRTFYWKWFNDVFRLKCLIWGHDTYAGWHNETQTSFDHCRRCERYNTERTLPSLNLWARKVYLQVRFEIWREHRKDKVA